MGEDLKTGVAIWHKISSLKIIALQFCMFAAASVLAVLFVKPAFGNRMETVFKADVHKVFAVLIAVHIASVCFAMKRVVGETYRANRDFFWQLTISKNSECVCTMLQKIAWYYYYILVLLVLSDGSTAGMALLLLGATLLYAAIFAVYYRAAGKAPWLKKEIRICHDPWSEKKNDPLAELLIFSVFDLYKCMTLAVLKAALVILLIYLGEIRVLNGKIFFFAGAALILLNDGYWRKESRNFPYFSSIGISPGKYLLIHILAGIWFNTLIPLLVFIVYTGETAAALFLWGIMIFLIAFWYMAQIYLYLTIDRKKELTITQCSILFLILGLFPGVNIAAAVLMYKKITYRWRRLYAVR